ncbi:hypothetical protein BFP72_06745 [Reichenbachiella sp. 5M10]|uniref:ATP-binding protein n=1 Tax=Reichenbachiella sp. 5M10 TaxID=1889772 RepID=UPI000C160BF1|nr:ATP-binding protein [Reichenbachiella sp. 5M10]PIB35113.1 hypothetical protein BFP72_06745 [Reichenbachiella sp. 5M10]
MQNAKVHFRDSIVSRFGLFFVGMMVIAMAVSGYLVYRESSQVIVTHSQQRIRHSSRLAKQNFYDLLQIISNDIAIVTHSSSVDQLVANPSRQSADELKHSFRVMLANKPDYFQIRILDVLDHGKELIRFDKQGGTVLEVPDSLLQYKGDKDYYLGALRSAKGGYYFSAINLNEEYGIVSKPYTPTLRAVGCVYDDFGQLRAMVVINVDLTRYYHELEQLIASESQLFITNSEDEYLFAPDKSKCFGRQLETGHSLYKDFNLNTWHLIAAAPEFSFMRDKEGKRYLYHAEKLSYAEGQQEIYLISFMESEALFASANRVRADSLKIVGAAMLLLVVLVLVFVRLIARRVGVVTQAILSYEYSDDSSHVVQLPRKRRDEIGLLGGAFANMRERIDRQVMELKEALRREQQAISDRDEFLQNMSHELRTPLNAILGLTHLIEKNNPAPQQRPMLDSLKRSTTNLSDLMYDILDHQKLLEGKVTIHLEPHNLNDLLQDIFASYQYEAVNKRLKWEMEVEEEVKQRVYLTDALRFKQVVTNLVVNAIKYTGEGRVCLVARHAARGVEISVSDTGRGIQSENLARIKQRFYRENEHVGTQRNEGFGLGLSIVKQIVDLFQGKLEVTSTYGEGSTFTVCLPFEEASVGHSSQRVAKKESVLPRLHRVHEVLHIEDDEAALLLVRHCLDQPQIRLTQVRTITEVQQQLADRRPELILSDLMLCDHVMDMDLQKIQAKYPDLLVVVLSAFDTDRTQRISPYVLQKPFDLGELLDLVLMVLGDTEYQRPQFQTVFAQYDNNPVHIERYLALLIREFEEYVLRIAEVYAQPSAKEWKAIMHRIITHIKALNLDNLGEVLPQELGDLTEARYDRVMDCMRYYLCCFRATSRLNSKG